MVEEDEGSPFKPSHCSQPCMLDKLKIMSIKTSKFFVGFKSHLATAVVDLISSTLYLSHGSHRTGCRFHMDLGLHQLHLVQGCLDFG